MPSPKNRLKLTGDTHLPDVGYELAGDERDDDAQVMVVEDADIVYADGWVPGTPESGSQGQQSQSQSQEQGAVQKLEQGVEQLPARKPWVAIGAALTVGWLFARMLRR
ncbi:MAG TPA: hypothetical protein VHL79_17620 [Ramlibacter sp.]|jgi:hypothetical protein|nr:hypothetical protein [Ramlibacter sp.]